MQRMGPTKHDLPPPGNAAAEFERLLRHHVPVLYRCAFRWTGSVERAEDLVQDLLTRLYPKLDEVRRLDRVRPWALRVMYRIFIDQLRHERSSPVQYGELPRDETKDSDDAEDSELTDPANEPPELAERKLTQEKLLAAWRHLGEEHRMVLSMHDIEGYSLMELSAMMDIPVGTAKSRLHRARSRLRTLLATERFAGSGRV